ncbi:MAG: hypothetical protein ACKV19_26515 [Verrucomicrobiales bacterium]
MKRHFIPFLVLATLGLGASILVGEDTVPQRPPALDEAAKKARDEEAKKKEAESERAEEELRKEAEPYTRRLKGDTAGKLWEVVQKGDDDALKATGLPAATIETLKAERPNLKGLHSILSNEKLGKEVLKQLVSYGGSAKFAKSIEQAAKEKEKAEKERVREKKKAQREREKESK